jgi:hypothetical protein
MTGAEARRGAWRAAWAAPAAAGLATIATMLPMLPTRDSRGASSSIAAPCRQRRLAGLPVGGGEGRVRGQAGRVSLGRAWRDDAIVC